MNQKRFLRPDAASDYLKGHYGFGSKKSLDKWASVGGGPEFHKMGRLRLYTPEALDEWALAKIGPAQASTSDCSKAA